MTACPAGSTVHAVLPAPAGTPTTLSLTINGTTVHAVLAAGQTRWIDTNALAADATIDPADPPGLTVECPAFRGPSWPAPTLIDTGATIDPPLAAAPVAATAVLPFTGSDPLLAVLGLAVIALGAAGIAASAGRRPRPNGAR